jgi:hypothetical protein
MKQFARTAAAVLVLCLLLPACTLDNTDGELNTQEPPVITADTPLDVSVVVQSARYGGPGPESEGTWFFDAETFYREREAWKALELEDYTFKRIYYHGKTLYEGIEKVAGNKPVSREYKTFTDISNYVHPATIDDIFRQIGYHYEKEQEGLLEGIVFTGEKGGVEVIYDPQYHYPVSAAFVHAYYQPHCESSWYHLDIGGKEEDYPFCAVCKVKAAQGDRNYQ